MAEAAVTFVLEKLYQLLSEETELLRGIHDEVAFIKDELESIRSFLKAAEERSAAGNGDDIQTWVKQVRDVAFRIEDTIDSYVLLMAQKNLNPRGLSSFLMRIKSLGSRREIASQIQALKVSVKEIKERSERYTFPSLELSKFSKSASWRDPRVESLFIEESEVVGIESSKDKIVGWLKNGADSRMVIAVVGMGGSGKTTLVKKIYDGQIITGYFDCYAWIVVSQSYKNEELLRTILKQFHKSRRESESLEINTMNETMLIYQLRKYLERKRYFIVFDDVWKIDFWAGLEHALLDNQKGSMIIITTRKKDVAHFCKKSSIVHVHEIQPLSPKKSWKLFCKKAFRFDFGGQCPPELEKLSFDIVEKCEGLPLAIVIIGGVLATKNKTILEWKKLHSSFNSELQSDPHLSSIDKILSLSYDDLPYYLKSCFLYFGIFPEDYSIECERLMRLWMAEGFVEHKQDKVVEEVAETYLTELINRSLVQVTWYGYDGKRQTCKVHDLSREIILRRMKDIGFCQIISSENPNSERTFSCRLSVNNEVYENLRRHGNSFRSLFVFNMDELPQSFLSKSFNNFKLLKVLDFQGAPLIYIPESVGNLFFLTYLSLRKTMVKELPRTIGKLLNLEFLDLEDSEVYEIPIEVARLSRLQYLSALNVKYGSEISFKGAKIHEGIRKLRNLQVLEGIELSNDGTKLIEELGMLTQLRKLGILKLTTKNGKALCATIERMRNLVWLGISTENEDEIIDLQHISSPPEFLQGFWLRGRLDKLPEWITKLQNIKRILLSEQRLKDDPLIAFQNLYNLTFLAIYSKAYDGEQMHFEAGGF